jgi:hypothetical protein
MALSTIFSPSGTPFLLLCLIFFDVSSNVEMGFLVSVLLTFLAVSLSLSLSTLFSRQPRFRGHKKRKREKGEEKHRTAKENDTRGSKYLLCPFFVFGNFACI